MSTTISCPVIARTLAALSDFADRLDMDDICGCGDWTDDITSRDKHRQVMGLYDHTRTLFPPRKEGHCACGRTHFGQNYGFCQTCEDIAL